jgi:hypothetical protein
MRAACDTGVLLRRGTGQVSRLRCREQGLTRAADGRSETRRGGGVPAGGRFLAMAGAVQRPLCAIVHSTIQTFVLQRRMPIRA